MRCPKCGYISFDNVEKCLKCKKNIADTSKLFQGSVLNVATPVFLNRTVEEEEVDIPVGGDEAVAEEEFEITDPDLEILLEDEEGSTAEVGLELESDEDTEMAVLDELNDDLSEIEEFSEEEAESDDEAPMLDLGMFDEDEEEVAAGEGAEAPAFEVPDELADISDLSPPEKSPERQAAAQEPYIDLDLGDFGDSLEEAEIAAAAASAAKSEKKPEEMKISLDMDEELDFNLDLGGLSIHDKSDK
jgi:hypothetical protein